MSDNIQVADSVQPNIQEAGSVEPNIQEADSVEPNIKVAIRVRPLIAREKAKNEAKLWKVEHVEEGEYISQVSSSSEKFWFDRVFDTKAENFDVYNQLCEPIVKKAMQGFNGTILAYGQTSSGKTYTMMGDHKDKKFHEGVIQYSVIEIFKYIQNTPKRQFLLRVSFLEIYQEKVHDLLSENEIKDLKVLKDTCGIANVDGLKEEIVQTKEQIWKLMDNAQKKRHTGDTEKNKVSSRSHAIFRMIIESREEDNDAAAVNVSQLNLVDLAGSENLKQVDAKDKQFKEGVQINSSLSALTLVLSKLSGNKKNQFVDYRSSKLTRLLQNSLEGNALTAIICAVTPASTKETLSTLKFASRAKKIKNKPMKNEILTDQALLRQYADKIKMLTDKLKATKIQGKELEEKTKQNNDLKLQIETLKAKFVSHSAIDMSKISQKSSRRETWGGKLDARLLQSFTSRLAVPSYFNLPILEEEPEGDTDVSELSANITSRRSHSLRIAASKSVSDAEIQTDPENEEQKPDIDEETMTIVSDLKKQLSTLQSELTELQTYTTLEKQYMKAESELQMENETLKNEIYLLKERLDSALSKLSVQPNSDLSPQKIIYESSCVSCQTSVLYSPEKIFSLKECQTSPLKIDANIMHLEERNSELERYNEDLRQKLIDLESSHSAQIEAFQTKLENTPSECDTKPLLMIKELEAKYEKELAEVKHQLKQTESNELSNMDYLQEKNSELEECKRDLEQKVCDLEASHYAQIEASKTEFAAAESEWNARSLSMIKELETKYEKELVEVKHQLSEAESQKLNDIKYLQQKCSELEEHNKDLKQKLHNLETSNCTDLKVVEARFENVQSELLLKVKDLEACQKKLADVEHQLKEAENHELTDIKYLQEKCSEFEQRNSELRQKITDLEASHWIRIKELEENFETERSEWSARTLTLVKDIETKYEQELTNQETQLTKDLQAMFRDRITVYIKEANELKEEVRHIKSQNLELTKRYSESLEKVDLISQLKEQKDKEILASTAKYDKMINEYKSRQRQCKAINSELKTRIECYMEEIEKIKKENKENKTVSHGSHLRENINDLSHERDFFLKKCTDAEHEISELKNELKKCHKELNEQKKLAKDMCSNKELEESNKMLRFDLDQKKAKIISLETNNESLVQEIKKLRDKLSTKVVPSTSKTNAKGLKPENLGNCDDFKEHKEKEKSEERAVAEVQENVITPIPLDDDLQEENNNPTKDKTNPSDPYLVGGGSGPANMVKCYWLEGILYQKDKEIKKLKKELADLNSEFMAIETRPKISEGKKIEVEKYCVGRTPLSPLQVQNEDLTVQTNSVPQQCQEVIPNVFGKQILKEKNKRKSIKPYDHPKSVIMKNENGISNEQLSEQTKENRQTPRTSADVINMISEEAPECRQQ